MSKTLKDLLIALTLANLCFMSAWRVVLDPLLDYSYYHWKFYPGFKQYGGLMIDVLLLALIFWGVATLARRSGKKSLIWVVRFAFLLALTIPLNDLRLQFHNAPSSVIGRLTTIFSFLPLLLALTAILVKRWRMPIFKVAVALILILSPFSLIVFLQGGWIAFKNRAYAGLDQDLPSIPLSLSKKPASRVVWIVFDELDQRLAFSQRPSDLQLPELDRLRREAIFANNAYPPADETVLSMPSLIIGKQISKALEVGPNELKITLSDGKEVGWSTQQNIFSTARAAGFNTALVGWYHPYCRVIGNSLSSCFLEATRASVVDEARPVRGRPTVLKSMSHWALIFSFRIPGFFRVLSSRYDLTPEGYRDHTEEYLHILAHARMAVANRENSLIFLHFPIPHDPFIYDRANNRFAARQENTYIDNLALTDRALGQIRSDMEAAGSWDDTTIIVTADHSWRTPTDGKRDKHIPFIIKMAGQKEGRPYDAICNTIVTSNFIMAVMNGQVSNPEAAVRWLDENH